MNNPAHDIAEYLASSAGGSFGTIGVELFVHYEPDSPDSAITVINSGGAQDPDMHGNSYPTVQIRVRKNKGGFTSAFTTLQAIVTELHASHGWINDGAYVAGVWQQGDAIPLGLDDKDRPTVVANFRLLRRADSSSAS